MGGRGRTGEGDRGKTRFSRFALKCNPPELKKLLHVGVCLQFRSDLVINFF